MTGLRVVVFFYCCLLSEETDDTTCPVSVSSDLMVLWRPICSSCKLKRSFMFYSRCDINCRTSSTSPPPSLSLRAGSRHIVANTFIWVISPSIVPRANQIITKAPNFDLRLWHCHLRVQPLICLAFWHNVFESGEIRILLGSVIDWKSISQSAAEADKSNKLFPVLLSISIITANTLMDKRATRSHLLTLHEATICRFLIHPVV